MFFILVKLQLFLLKIILRKKTGLLRKKLPYPFEEVSSNSRGDNIKGEKAKKKVKNKFTFLSVKTVFNYVK